MDEALSENRWLSPSPHREEVLKAIEEGRAFIEERGHNIAPLLVFEGEGGAIEMPRARYTMTHRGMQLVAAGDSSPNGTKHPDVCGTIEELKCLLKDGSETARTHPDVLKHLLADACHMISRMQRRAENYEKFARDVASLCRGMAAIEKPEVERAYQEAEAIRAILQHCPGTVTPRIADLCESADKIRDVADKLESCLSAYKERAVEIGTAYDEIKGGRSWKRREGS